MGNFRIDVRRHSPLRLRKRWCLLSGSWEIFTKGLVKVNHLCSIFLDFFFLVLDIFENAFLGNISLVHVDRWLYNFLTVCGQCSLADLVLPMQSEKMQSSQFSPKTNVVQDNVVQKTMQSRTIQSRKQCSPGQYSPEDNVVRDNVVPLKTEQSRRQCSPANLVPKPMQSRTMQSRRQCSPRQFSPENNVVQDNVVQKTMQSGTMQSR